MGRLLYGARWTAECFGGHRPQDAIIIWPLCMDRAHKQTAKRAVHRLTIAFRRVLITNSNSESNQHLSAGNTFDAPV